jgi:hypothetical protein
MQLNVILQEKIYENIRGDVIVTNTYVCPLIQVDDNNNDEFLKDDLNKWMI